MWSDFPLKRRQRREPSASPACGRLVYRRPCERRARDRAARRCARRACRRSCSGYPDGNDFNRLRFDSGLKACLRSPARLAKTSARNRPSRAGRMRQSLREIIASTINSSISGAELLEAEWSLISIIQSMLWRGTNRNHRQREVVDERADSFIAKGRLPCDDGVQSADRRARNLGEAAGAPPITPAKSGYSTASKAHPSPNSVQTPCDTRFADR